MAETELTRALARHEASGRYEPLLRPLLKARLFVAGAAFGPGEPVFYARPDPDSNMLFLTASEEERPIADNDGVVPIRRTGLALVNEMEPELGLYLLAGEDGYLFDAEQVDWFRQAYARDKVLQSELRQLG